MYPQLMIACIIFFLFDKLKSKKQQIVAVIATLLIMLPTYKHNYVFGELGFERTYYRAANMRYWFPDPKEAERICNEAKEPTIKKPAKE